MKFVDLCVFEIFDHKMQISWPRCWATGVVMATILCLTCWGGGPYVSFQVWTLYDHPVL